MKPSPADLDLHAVIASDGSIATQHHTEGSVEVWIPALQEEGCDLGRAENGNDDEQNDVIVK